jgi:hypothetical protein
MPPMFRPHSRLVCKIIWPNRSFSRRLVDVLERYLPSASQEERQPHTASLAIPSHTPQNPPQVPARISAADRLTAQWQKRQREALDAVSDAVHKDRLDGTAAVDLARILHNIAGTAGKFGECELGIRAGALERALKNGDQFDRRTGRVFSARALNERISGDQMQTAAPKGCRRLHLRSSDLDQNS